MDFYERKKRAAFFIDNTVNNAKKNSIAALILIVEKEYGLSEAFVRKRLTLLVKAGHLLIDREKETYTWVK